MQSSRKIPLFISHSSDDKTLVSAINHFIKRTFLGIFDIFDTTSSPITLGHKWREDIRDNLERAEVVLVILTPNSVTKEWVMFESGAAWLEAEKSKVTLAPEKHLIPCLIHLKDYPTPLSEIQGTDLTQEAGIRELYKLLKDISQLEPDETLVSQYIQDLQKALEKPHVHSDETDPLTPYASKSEIDRRLLKVVLSFFNDKPQAKDFGDVLKRQGIWSEGIYTELLDELMKKRP